MQEINWRVEFMRVLAYILLLFAGRGGYDTIFGGPGAPPMMPPPGHPGQPAPPPGQPVPVPRVDPEQAICRITSGGSGCTATVIGPSPVKGVQLLLSAAHCVRGRGAPVRVYHKSGRVYDGVVYAHYPPSDSSLIVIKTADQLPYAKVAEKPPAEGTRIWHMGYGVDKPGNREEGQVIRAGTERSFAHLSIRVSSGDSGCGFFRKDNGELVATCYGTGGGFTIGPGVDAIRSFLKAAQQA